MSTIKSRELALLDQAKKALESAQTFDELKQVRDQAEAVRHYARSASLGLELQNFAAELKLRAERKAGRLLDELSLWGGDRKSSCHQDSLKLADFGISQNQSSRWQREARVDDKSFEQYLRDARESGREITANGLIRLLRANANLQTGVRRSVRAFELNVPTEQRPIHRGRAEPAIDENQIEAILEVQNHCRTLLRILDPLLTGETTNLRVKQRRLVRRLLNEIGELIGETGLKHRHPTRTGRWHE